MYYILPQFCIHLCKVEASRTKAQQLGTQLNQLRHDCQGKSVHLESVIELNKELKEELKNKEDAIATRAAEVDTLRSLFAGESVSPSRRTLYKPCVLMEMAVHVQHNERALSIWYSM